MTRVALASNPLFINVPPRPYRSGRTAPRLVENLMGGVSSTAYGYERYQKDASSSWGDFPSNTSEIVWGYTTDGGQWFQATATLGGVERVWASLTFPAVLC